MLVCLSVSLSLCVKWYECTCDEEHDLTPSGTGCVGLSLSLSLFVCEVV